MWKKIESYSLFWDASNHSGTIYLQLADDTEGSIKHLSQMEVAAFGDILRNEECAWYHSIRGDISTEKTPRYEEERS